MSHLTLKCTKFDFGCGSAPDPTGGAYSAPPDLRVRFKGATSKGKEKKKGEIQEGPNGGRKEKGRRKRTRGST